MGCLRSKVLEKYDIVAAPRKRTSKTLEIFRGIKDVLPSQVNHRYDGDGVFGQGTYYALEEHHAEQYATGAIGLVSFTRFALVFGYEVSPNSPLVLTPEVAKGLLNGDRGDIEIESDEFAEEIGFPMSLPRKRLGTAALQSEFDAVLLKAIDHGYGGIDGEDQMLIPKGSPLKPTPKWVDVIFHDDDEEIAEDIAKKVGGNITTVDGNVKLVNTPLSKLKTLSTLLAKTSTKE